MSSRPDNSERPKPVKRPVRDDDDGPKVTSEPDWEAIAEAKAEAAAERMARYYDRHGGGW